MKTFFFISVFFILSTILSATIINVPADQPTIQEGINVAVDGDTVLVQPDTYVENIDYIGKNITVASLFLTTQDTTYISQTIIDGDSIASVVSFVSGEDARAKLTGFTITNGYSENGGGIYCYNNSNPTIENCIFETNSAYYGGGIYCCAASPTIVNCIFNGNSDGENGGGICFYESVSLIENCTFIGNSAMFGGGIKCWNNSSPIIKNCILRDNWADVYGGGIDCAYWCNPLIENCTVIGNSSEFGAGISSTNESNPEIINCTISENSANENGGGIWCYNSSTSIINSIISDNSNYGIYVDSGNPSIWYSDFWDNESGNFYNCGTGIGINMTTNANGDSCDINYNIQLEPLFADSQNGDFHLTWANFPIPDETKSPCIDAGDPNSPFDPDNTIADIGAFYFDQNQQGVEDTQILPVNCLLYQNYPKPFNPETTISFNITAEDAENAELVIYNLKGQKVKIFYTFPNRGLGTREVVWNGTDENNQPVSSGIYFYKMKSGNYNETKKMLLLK